MNKVLFLAIFVTIVFFSCGKKPVSSNWLVSEIIVDGEASDWESTPAQIIEKNDASMRILNDTENLYLLFQFTNPDLAKKAFMGGFKIWFDKKRKRGLVYRGSFALAESLRTLKSSDNMQKAARAGKQSPAPDLQTIKNIGRILMQTHDGKNSFSENEQKVPQAGSTFKNGIFCYEFVVPLLDWDGLPFVANIEEEEYTDLGLEFGGMDPANRERVENRSNSMGGRQGGMGGGRGGMGGGKGGMGGRGGGRGGQRPQRTASMDSEEIWFKVKLANAH